VWPLLFLLYSIAVIRLSQVHPSHARAEGRRIREGRPLENRGQNQGNGEKATVPE
jgi:hypothetical protein